MTTHPGPQEPPQTSEGSGGTHWPMRSWGLAALGGLVGLAIHLVGPDGSGGPALHLALATFLGVASLVFGFVIERGRVLSSVAFAIVAGAIVAGAIYWNGPFDSTGQGEPWRIVCAALTIGIGAPLYQAARSRPPGAPLSYSAVYDRAWGNVMLWCGTWVFVGIVWLVAYLLSSLFDLIGIDLLETLLRKDWMGLLLTGTAFGGAAGVLRDRETILGLLQWVVTTVLSVLAPVLALGLALFLGALPFTGLAPLWEATRSTTPVVLVCLIGALVLINAVVNNQPEQEARHPALRPAVIVLSLAILPLGAIAAVSTGSRVSQYGLTPDRLWAMVFIGIACAYGLAYLGAVLRGRLTPAPFIRTANLTMAYALCGLAFLLSTPLVNFGAISARNQVARLTSGEISTQEFDWLALRFDFGPAGVSALQHLARDGGSPAIREAANSALKQKNRWGSPIGSLPEAMHQPMVVLPRQTPLPTALQTQLANVRACPSPARCVVLYEAGSKEAIVVTRDGASLWCREGEDWSNDIVPAPDQSPEAVQRREAGLAAGEVEVRTVTRRQVFVAGEPVGLTFE